MTIDPRLSSVVTPGPMPLEFRGGIPFGPITLSFTVSKTDTTPVAYTGVDSAQFIVCDPRSGRTLAVGSAVPVLNGSGECTGLTLSMNKAETGKIRSACIANPTTTEQPQSAGRAQVFFVDAQGDRYLFIDTAATLRFVGAP